ncbi:MAG: S8/S53 family peptidase [Salinivirgaceae bacterium]|nr:S8/S53 family peptidase [Salinivirgaceae bacterium]
MEKLKLIAIKDVNIRTGKPERNDNNLKGVIFKGVKIEIDADRENPIKGEFGEDGNTNKVWYKDGNGDYLWSGGFDIVNSDLTISNSDQSNSEEPREDFQTFIISSYDKTNYKLTKKIDYNLEIDSKCILGGSKGDKVKIAIMDHPIPSFPFFKNPISEGWSGGEIHDHHGIFMAGLIAGYSWNEKGIEGIASNSQLVSFPLYIDGFFINDDDLIKNLKTYFKKNPERLLINISHDWTSPSSKLENYFSELAKKHIVVASAGEDKQLLNDDTIQWPASIENIISVGALSKNFMNNNPNPKFSSKIDLLAPNYEVASYTHLKSNPYFLDNGDSCATAFASGLIANILAIYQDLNKDQVLRYIYELDLLENSTLNAFQKLNLIKPTL